MFKKKKKNLPMKTWKNCPQKLLIIESNFILQYCQWPKISPNLIFCSIKMAPWATSIYIRNDFGAQYEV